ncbi:MAG TPA: DUF4351 domain-containing protein [Povalibacter sp.]|nr:DUF4351 domain-containing protein [Povalibacter sp.]
MAAGRNIATNGRKFASRNRRRPIDLDEERSRLYFDLILNSLSEAARRALRNMDPAKYEYQSDFARKYVAQGRAEGRAEGRASLIIRQPGRRFGPLQDEVCGHIASASIEELDAIGERLLTAHTLQEALGPR